MEGGRRGALFFAEKKVYLWPVELPHVGNHRFLVSVISRVHAYIVLGLQGVEARPRFVRTNTFKKIMCSG